METARAPATVALPAVAIEARLAAAAEPWLAAAAEPRPPGDWRLPVALVVPAASAVTAGLQDATPHSASPAASTPSGRAAKIAGSGSGSASDRVAWEPHRT